MNKKDILAAYTKRAKFDGANMASKFHNSKWFDTLANLNHSLFVDLFFSLQSYHQWQGHFENVCHVAEELDHAIYDDGDLSLLVIECDRHVFNDLTLVHTCHDISVSTVGCHTVEVKESDYHRILKRSFPWLAIYGSDKLVNMSTCNMKVWHKLDITSSKAYCANNIEIFDMLQKLSDNYTRAQENSMALLRTRTGGDAFEKIIPTYGSINPDSHAKLMEDMAEIRKEELKIIKEYTDGRGATNLTVDVPDRVPF